ncbi:hypothetical protein [Peribacillus tepidiphilus]|uniref:hypothetical protein n=1 Tax=Peribacillus tepidiphilus TaxID=2652445 RepID=UPI001290AD36|nr:hypothetical protein [Peribacillus tepidiphilus]
MKIIGIIILIMGLLIGFSLSIDILIGIDLNTALQNALYPFLAMEGAELFVLFLFILILVIESILFSKKERKTSNSTKQSQVK